MKEKIVIAAIASAALALAGCGGKAGTKDEDLVQSPTEEVQDDTLTDTSEDTTAEIQGSVEDMQENEQTDSVDNGVQNEGEQDESIYEEREENKETETAAVYAEYIKITGADVNIRSGAGTGYKILGTAEKDTLYACTGETDGWYKIYYLNTAAYISKNYSTVYEMAQSKNSAVESVIEQGAKLLGTQYVYGAVRYHDGSGNLNAGFTNSKFDCSSLTQYIFYKGADGLLLDVTTRTQVKQGVTVKKADLQRGDLLFFTNSSRVNNTGIERIGHVALYLGGNFILHTSSDYAKIEEISSQRWSYFIQAQRML